MALYNVGGLWLRYRQFVRNGESSMGHTGVQFFIVTEVDESLNFMNQGISTQNSNPPFIFTFAGS